MSRSVREWIGKTDDERVPARVADRLHIKYGGSTEAGCTCQICFAPIRGSVEIDHRIAIINGGENRERNLVPVHPKCHKRKTAQDLLQKAATARTRKHHLGLKTPKYRWGYGKSDPMKKKVTGEVVPR